LAVTEAQVVEAIKEGRLEELGVGTVCGKCLNNQAPEQEHTVFKST